MESRIDPKEPRINPKVKKSQEGMPEREEPTKQIIVYICPTEDCPNYYGAPDFRPDRDNITAMQFRRSQNDGSMSPAHPRTECPFCRDRGLRVQRVGYVVTEMVALDPIVRKNAAA